MVENIPFVLAGPIVRHTSKSKVVLWLATSEDAEISTRLYVKLPSKSGVSRRIDIPVNLTRRTVTIADTVLVHLIQLDFSHESPPPLNTKIFYSINAKNDDRFEVNLKSRMQKLSFDGHSDPFFLLPFSKSELELSVIYGSCRRLGSDVRDAVLGVEKKLTRDKLDSPHLLVLGGDQIYADDDSDIVYSAVADAAQLLFPERTWKKRKVSPPELKALGFTSQNLNYHLSTLEEWVALYLISWSSELYFKNAEEDDLLSEVRAWERVFAHIPTYMIFDDHEVTDDWNIDGDWARQKAPEAIEIISYAIASYFLFQGWGNAPNDFSEDEISNLQSCIDENDFSKCEITNKQGWSFVVPANIPICALDCRTTRFTRPDGLTIQEILDTSEKRSYFIPKPELMVSVRELNRISESLKAQFDTCEKLVVCVNTPVFGRRIIEWGQSVTTAFFSRNKYDVENWEVSPRSWIELIDQLLTPCRVKHLAILAGDVHYSYTCSGALVDSTGERIEAIQIVSSAAKNKFESVLALNVLESFGKLGNPFGSQVITAIWNNRFLLGVRGRIRTRLLDAQIGATSKLLGSTPYKKVWRASSLNAEPSIALIEVSDRKINILGIAPDGRSLYNRRLDWG